MSPKASPHERLAVVIPALDEAQRIGVAIEQARRIAAEVIVVDGGSLDATRDIAQRAGARVVVTAMGRANQMNVGAAACVADALVFLHADTRLPPQAASLIDDALDAGHAWGRFDVRLEPSTLSLRVVAGMMNLRSRATGIATGDQAIFVTREAFVAVGGFPALELMEDIAMSTRLKRDFGAPACLTGPVVADARRWHRDGVFRTIATMWWLRLLFWFGVDHRRLRRRYYGDGHHG